MKKSRTCQLLQITVTYYVSFNWCTNQLNVIYEVFRVPAHYSFTHYSQNKFITTFSMVAELSTGGYCVTIGVIYNILWGIYIFDVAWKILPRFTKLVTGTYQHTINLASCLFWASCRHNVHGKESSNWCFKQAIYRSSSRCHRVAAYG